MSRIFLFFLSLWRRGEKLCDYVTVVQIQFPLFKVKTQKWRFHFKAAACKTFIQSSWTPQHFCAVLFKIQTCTWHMGRQPQCWRLWHRSEAKFVCLLKHEKGRQNPVFNLFRIVHLYQIGGFYYFSDYHLLHLIAHLLYSEGRKWA